MNNRNNVPIPGHKPRPPMAYSPELINDDLKKFIRDHEDIVRYLYLDTNGNVTTGVGQKISNAEMAKKLPLFVHSSTDKPLREARSDEKDRIFRQIKSLPYGSDYTASYYEPKERSLQNLRLKDPDIEFMLETQLRASAQSLEKKRPDLPNIPQPARKSMMDMEFQLGPSGFSRSNWPKLFDALDRRDYAAAAEQSHRDIKEEYRNENTKRGFLDAATIERRRKSR